MACERNKKGENYFLLEIFEIFREELKHGEVEKTHIVLLYFIV